MGAEVENVLELKHLPRRIKNELLGIASERDAIHALWEQCKKKGQFAIGFHTKEEIDT